MLPCTMYKGRLQKPYEKSEEEQTWEKVAYIIEKQAKEKERLARMTTAVVAVAGTAILPVLSP